MTTTENAADFVERFRDFWSSPVPERLDIVLSQDVVLAAPAMPTTQGLAEAKLAWAGLLGLIPDLSTEVVRWAASDDGVFIEFTLSGTVAGSEITWPAVDRFVLNEDGLASERVGYFDPSPLLAAMAGPHPA